VIGSAVGGIFSGMYPEFSPKLFRECSWRGWTASALLLIVGCTGGQQARPRTSNDIFLDRLKVDTLFLAPDGERIVRPMNPDRLVVIDAATGKIAWPANQCNNPDCPGRVDRSPHLFPWPRPFVSVQADGTVLERSPLMAAGGGLTAADQKLFDNYAEQKCPACLKKRKLASESAQQRQQYKDWCLPYVLPSAAQRLTELDLELQQLLARRPARK